MRVGEGVLGGLVALLGAVLVAAAWSLPDIPGQSYGAATFPVAIGFGLAAVGGVMAARGVLAGDLAVRLAGWGRSRGAWLRLVLTVVLVLLYVALADRVGFLIAGTGLLAALFLTFRAPLAALPLAPAAALAIAWAFGNVLRVPLPRGLLSGLW